MSCNCKKVKKDDDDAFVTFLGVAASPFVYAWLLMLGMGAAHSAVAAVPAVGFWTAMGIWYGMVAVKFGLFRRLNTKP